MVAWVAANREWLESKIHEGIQVVIDKARDLYTYLSAADWTEVWKTLIAWITQVQLQFGNFFDFLKANWPEIKKFVSDFADDVRRVAGFIDDVVRATTGWGKAAEIFFALWAFSKFAPIIGALSAIVGLIGGANTGILGLAGNFALLALRLAPVLAMLSATGFAGGEAKQFSDEKNKEFLDTLSGPESGGDYTMKQGGSHFEDFSQFPEGVGPGGTSTAAGRYQFISGTWHDVANKLGLKDFSPENQDKAAWYLAASRYHQKTGGDLEADVKAGKYFEIAAALKDIWPSLPGGSQSHQTMDQFIGKFSKNLNTLGEKTQPRPTGDPNKPPEVPRSPVSDLSVGAKASPAARTTSNTTNSSTS